MISFGLTEEQELIRDTLRDFANEAMRPIGRACDEAFEIPEDFLDLVMELRESQASAYTLRDTPVFTCIARPIRQCLDALG